MQPIKDGVYDKKTGEGETEWVGYLGGNGIKLNLGEADGWNNQVGKDGDNFVLNNGGSGDIKVATPGVYRVVFNTTGAKGAKGNTPAQITIEPYEGNAPTYSKICMAGEFNGWSEKDNAMSPVHTCAGENNHDWYMTIENPEGGTVKFTNGTWDTNWGVDTGGVLTLQFRRPLRMGRSRWWQHRSPCRQVHGYLQRYHRLLSLHSSELIFLRRVLLWNTHRRTLLKRNLKRKQK